MKKRLEELYREYMEVLNNPKLEKKNLDYSILDRHIRLLKQLGIIENRAITIFDMYQKKHVYISSSFETNLDYDVEKAHREGNDYFDSKVHEDDLEQLLINGIDMIHLMNELPRDKAKDFKLVNDYRIKSGKCGFIRVIEQHQLLETDAVGNYWLSLSVMDLSPDQDLSTPLKSRLINFKTKETFELPHFDHSNSKKSVLSSREKEVLHLITEGLISKQIADKLFISVHTVNTHRQRIIEKLNVSNTFEAIKYATKLGILD